MTGTRNPPPQPSQADLHHRSRKPSTLCHGRPESPTNPVRFNPDHTGGLAEIARRAPQAQIICGLGDAASIRDATGISVEGSDRGSRFSA